jgi:hypothetical protein
MRKKKPKVEKINYSNNVFNRVFKRVGQYKKTTTHGLSEEDLIYNKLCDATIKYKKGETWISTKNSGDFEHGWIIIDSKPFEHCSNIYVMARQAEYTGKKPNAYPLDTYFLKDLK